MAPAPSSHWIPKAAAVAVAVGILVATATALTRPTAENRLGAEPAAPAAEAGHNTPTIRPGPESRLEISTGVEPLASVLLVPTLLPVLLVAGTMVVATRRRRRRSPDGPLDDETVPGAS